MSVFAGEKVDFSREVLPILSDNCFHCHGPDASRREGRLRLDVEAEAKKRAIVPGSSEKSRLYQRIVTPKERRRMPPKHSNRKLTKQQIATLKRWIDEGASWGEHWGFTRVVRPPLPKLKKHAARVRNAIDTFVFARLEREGLSPSPPASKARLIRRVTLDLTGLPPTPQEVDAFEKDLTPQTYNIIVSRLLNSPAFGERMAWNWLDAARYADTNGYQGDRTRTMWPWRDWVVEAFNKNMPYDKFTTWQLAGDLLPKATQEQKLATGFCRNHMINGEGGRIAEENRVEYVFDMTETMGTVWLGLTLNCCRCHDHKYDPIAQKEYYQFSAFFNQTPVKGNGGNPQTPPIIEVTRRGQKAKVMVMADMKKRRPTFILDKGLYNKRGKEVSMGVPESLPEFPSKAPVNRLGLAKWLTSRDHPLTARVTVNRIWQQIFGTGLVKTTEDFGRQGEKPSHPELLDWLAAEFMESGWDVKHLLRLIVTSETYRQTSRVSKELLARDPKNRLLARMSRFRMPSWMLRDQALAASGLLVRKLGGPSVNPYQPKGVWAESTFGKIRYKQDHGEALYRRSLYTFWRRIIRPTIFFDSAKRQTCTVKQTSTNTPLHALTTLNDITYVEASRKLAERVLLSKAKDTPGRLELAFRYVLARKPNEREAKILHRCLMRAKSYFDENPKAAQELLSTGESASNKSLNRIEHASYAVVCQAILNLDEALTRE